MRRKKKMKKIIIIVFIILIILIIFLAIFNNMQSRDTETISEEFRYSLEPDEEVEKLSDDVMIANNSYKFFSNYFKKIDAKDIQENWDNFTRIVVPKYTQTITSSKEAQKYYNSNKYDILVDTGIDNEEDFELLIEKITSKYTKKLNTLKSIDILEESEYDDDDEITSCKMKAIYDDKIEIVFYFNVYDEKDSDGVFIVYE